MTETRPIIALLTDHYFEYQASVVELLASELSSVGYASLCITLTELQNADSHNTTGKTANSFLMALNQYNISGVIALSGTLVRSNTPDTLIEILNDIDKPVVSTGFELANVPSVILDESSGMQSLMDHLVSSGKRKRFTFIRGYENDPYSLAREAIFRSTLQAHGHDPEKCEYIRGNFNAYTAYQSVDSLLARGAKPDCIVAANDIMAASAGRAAKANGFSIPSDIAISGFDDTAESTSHSPTITTVRMPTAKLAKESVNLLIRQIQAAEPQTTFSAALQVPTELIIRQSTTSSNIDAELNQSISEPQLRQLLTQMMKGLDTPDGLCMQDISEPLWQTLINGRNDIIHFAEGLRANAIFQHNHWSINMCDKVEEISKKLLKNKKDDSRMAIISSAIFSVREKVWALEMDQHFELTRLHNVRYDMMLDMSSCSNVEDICSAMDRWVHSLKTPRSFLVCYPEVSTTPGKQAQLVHVFRNGEIEVAESTPFDSKMILPEAYHGDLCGSFLVMCPICVDDMLFGYLLLDPSDMLLTYIDAAAQCIGNAMRTHYHFGELQQQRDTLETVNEELEKVANYDLLTGLANRLQFSQYLENCCNEASANSPFTLLFIDLDGFKLINDTLGHSVGDELLGKVAQRLKNLVNASRHYEGFIARLGGDEFTVILQAKNNQANIHQTADQFLELLYKPYELNEKIVSVSASIGCATYPTDATDAESVVLRADIAMYEAKNKGKNKVVFSTPDMVKSDNHELQLAQDLRYALNNDELCMYYQPRIDLKTGKMHTAEALMRWLIDTPDGLKPKAYPDEFIALAEKIGVIEKLDTYALEHSCKQAAKWSAAGTPLPISVNVSVKQLQQSSFVPTVQRAIEKYNLDPSLLELEITETAAMTDVENNIAKLSEIKLLGITISIDDFGTGYSSLNYLKRLPVDNLKIDRSFIMDIDQSDGGDSADASIVRAVVALGKSMGFGLVAEGIETEEQNDFIKSLDCDQAQGYLFNQPLPADQITKILLDDQGDLPDKDLAA